MREVERGAFIRLESALLACLADMQNVDGLKLAPVAVSELEVEIAACTALMALTKGFVRPVGVKFLSGFGTPGYREF